MPVGGAAGKTPTYEYLYSYVVITNTRRDLKKCSKAWSCIIKLLDIVGIY